MHIINPDNLNDTQKNEIYNLWNNEYPEKICYNSLTDFENYLKNLIIKKQFILIDNNNKIKGWGISFLRYEEIWFAIIISTDLQGKRFGTKILNLLKLNENTLNGWVIDHFNDKKRNGEIYKSPLSFYLKNDFNIISEIRLELKNISAVKIVWNNNFKY